MTDQIHQLVYCSRLRSPMESRQAEIDSILATSRRNNARAGITGGLFVTGDTVAQLLEGPIDATERTYAKICADPRHREVITLRRRGVARRIFPTWAMGFEITVHVTDETRGILAQGFTVQNDDIADAVTNLMKESIVRIEM
jgi:hypothetical protein